MQAFAIAGILIAAAALVPCCGAIETRVESSESPPWLRHTIDASSKGADGVKLGDINGDGRLDLVTGWEEGGVVRLYLNPGAADAKKAWPTVTVGAVRDAEDAIIADLDGDGRLEIVSCTEGKTKMLFWHCPPVDAAKLTDGAGWTTHPFSGTAGQQMWMQAVAMNIDDLNGIDLLVGSKNTNGAIGWLTSPADSKDLAAWRYHRLRDAGWIMSLVLHDLDGDADLDVVFSDRKGARRGVFWLENPGSTATRAQTAWPEHPIGALDLEVMFADIGDVNSDGLTDVAVAIKPTGVVLCLRTTEGGWQHTTIHLDGTHIGDAKAVKIADINLDGLADILYTCENAKGDRAGIIWLEQQKQDSWLQHSLGGPAGIKFDLMQTLDLDADGDPDVITCEERDQLGVIWYENPHR